MDQLPLGDFVWRVDIKTKDDCDYSFIYDTIIERKILNDLTQSVIDGRYKEQKNRLVNSGIDRIVYLVEGHKDLLSQVGESSLFSLKVFSSLVVIRTVDIKETVFKISMLHNRIRDELMSKEEFSFKFNWAEYKKINRKGYNTTIEKTTYDVLTSFPGLGIKTGNSVALHFGSIKNLINHVNQEDFDAEKDLK